MYNHEIIIKKKKRNNLLWHLIIKIVNVIQRYIRYV